MRSWLARLCWVGAVAAAIPVAPVAAAPPRPLAAWTTNPFEVRVALDQPIAPRSLPDPSQVTIDFLEPPSRAGESRFDGLTSGRLRVAAVKLTRDRRTLILATDPHPMPVDYHLVVPTIQGEGDLAQQADLHVTYNLEGVAAAWRPSRGRNGPPVWTGWLPTLDIRLALLQLQDLSVGRELRHYLGRPGQITLKTLLYPPDEPVTLQLQSASLLQVLLDERPVQCMAGAADRWSVDVLPGDDYHSLTLVLATGARREAPRMNIVWLRKNRQPLTFWLPWAPPLPPLSSTVPAVPALAGGDFVRGGDLFNGNQLKCATCHRLRGQGGSLAPDLTTQYQRAPAAVLNDIINPSSRLNPGYVSFNLTLRGGIDLTAFVHLQRGGRVQLVESDGKTNVVKRAEIEAIRPTPISLMPTGLIDALTPNQVRDLLTFLLAPPSAVRSNSTGPLRPRTRKRDLTVAPLAVLATSQPRT